jgi:arsenite methyltransferase
MKRLHVHVSVDDLAQSTRFYSTLFAAEPTVVKDDYVKWMLDDPRVNFAISMRAGRAAGISHLGIQAEDEAELAEVYDRLARAERPIVEAKATTCCYAESDKQWIADPQGVPWETFLTYGESTVYGEGSLEKLKEVSEAACCAPICCEPKRSGKQLPSRRQPQAPAARVSRSDEEMMETGMEDAKVKEMVRARYGGIAAASGAASCCAPASSCCGDAAPGTPADKSRQMGYSDAELAAVPDGANLGLGCGNPQAIAVLKPGEVVVDLGSGAGFDCFLAAKQVGDAGRVIGVDMTHEMLNKARENAAKISAANVEFRLGELEHLPVADNTADAILSNCVINLVPDKAQVFREAFRVLKPGGRLAISDVVNTAPLSPELQADPALLCGCIAGAAPVEQIETWLAQAGFIDVRVTPQLESRELVASWAPGRGIENFVASATVEARKPGDDGGCCG